MVSEEGSRQSRRRSQRASSFRCLTELEGELLELAHELDEKGEG